MTRYITCVTCNRLLGIVSLNGDEKYYDYTILSNDPADNLLNEEDDKTYRWTGHYERCHPEIHKQSKMDDIEIQLLSSKYFTIIDTMLKTFTQYR